MSNAVHRFHGGVHPPMRKTLSNQSEIVRAPVPERLWVPLWQHNGPMAQVCVSVGERVEKGQCIGRAYGERGVAVHAPTSGTVESIQPFAYPHPSGDLVETVVIMSDGEDRWRSREPWADFREQSHEALWERISQAGLAGLGGAGFPTHRKLQTPITTLIINGAECEPYITADDRLMRERAEQVLLGIDVLVHLLSPQRVLIGLEDNTPEALAALKAAMGVRAIECVVVPALYPSGGERQLIHLLTGEEVGSGQRPADLGMLCLNVGTCAALYEAVVLDQPLISRIITLTGEALASPKNVEALIGTPCSELLALGDLNDKQADRVLMGGPMMGFAIPDLHAPVVKTTNCLLALKKGEWLTFNNAMPCIRCGDCAEVCPAQLQPQQLHRLARAEAYEAIQVENLFDCIECGACSYVCPSSLDLVADYQGAKRAIREQEDRQRKAEQARIRFEQRQARLQLEQARKDAEREARAARRLQEKANVVADPVERAKERVGSSNVSDEVKQLKIQASMARVVLAKTEKQLAMRPSDELSAQVETLRQAAEVANAALAEAEARQAAQTGADSAAGLSKEQISRLKIEGAQLRVQMRKLQKAEPLDQAAVDQLAQRLAEIDAQLVADAPEVVAPPKPEAAPRLAKDPVLKQAKVAFAVARANVKQGESNTALSEDERQALQQAYESAKARLEEAEAQSTQPAPERTLVEKRPVSSGERDWRTQTALARAELKRLQRRGAAEEEIAAAQARLQALEDNPPAEQAD